ncbi:MAG: sodium:proton exchanger [Polyangiaceae bacterium]
MSATARSSRSWQKRTVQAAALVVVFGLVMAATRLAPDSRGLVGTVAGLGLLLLAGTLTSELTEIAGLPHLSGYLLAGFVSGPNVLALIDHDTIDRLGSVNTLAIALIALAGGAELRVEILRSALRSLGTATVLQHSVVTVAGTFAFVLIARRGPFEHLGLSAIWGVALLWGVVSASRSPAALLGVLSELRPAGPLTTFSVAFVMFSDLVVVILLAIVSAFVRPLLDASYGLSFDDLRIVGHEMLGSVALGVTLGIALSIYLRLVDRSRLLVLLVLGFGLSELLRYIQFDALLSFLVAGFFVRNFSEQGPKLVQSIQRTGAVVFVIFFALAGAHVDLAILKLVGPIALALSAIRFVVTVGVARASSRIARDTDAVRRWGWSPMISQAGLTLGMGVVVARTFPAFGEAFQALTVACVTINEIVGPILFKLGLDRAGESGMGTGEAAEH